MKNLMTGILLMLSTSAFAKEGGNGGNSYNFWIANIAVQAVNSFSDSCGATEATRSTGLCKLDLQKTVATMQFESTTESLMLDGVERDAITTISNGVIKTKVNRFRIEKLSHDQILKLIVHEVLVAAGAEESDQYSRSETIVRKIPDYRIDWIKYNLSSKTDEDLLSLHASYKASFNAKHFVFRCNSKNSNVTVFAINEGRSIPGFKETTPHFIWDKLVKNGKAYVGLATYVGNRNNTYLRETKIEDHGWDAINVVQSKFDGLPRVKFGFKGLTFMHGNNPVNLKGSTAQAASFSIENNEYGDYTLWTGKWIENGKTELFECDSSLELN